jgi:hypothetical protein
MVEKVKGLTYRICKSLRDLGSVGYIVRAMISTNISCNSNLNLQHVFL